MAKRIFEIANELGIKSKAVIEKCVAEGIPQDKVKNHMASISPGLEASIREWFSGGEGGRSATAVETASQVDLETVKRRPARRKARPARAKSEPSSEDNGRTAEKAAAGADTQTKSPAPAQAETSAPAPDQPETKPAPEHAPSKTEKKPADDSAQQDGDRSTGALEAAASATESTEAKPKKKGKPDDGDKPAPTPTMNVPARPKVVAPAGPRLEKQTPVKLSGPKVVRVERPDVVDAPRRRGGGTYAGGPPTEPAWGGEDRPGSPRRNKRRGPAAGAGSGGGPGGPGGRGGASTRRKGRGEEGIGTGLWREQDLLEREARLQRAGGFLKKRRHEMKSKAGQGTAERPAMPAETGGVVKIAAPFTIKDLSAATGVKVSDIVKRLFMEGVMATANSGIDTGKAQEILLDYNIELEVTEAKSAEERVTEQFHEREAVDERPRGPIVTILGHVDHGKTSLLDKIRDTNVAAGEAGGITQATSAFRVAVEVGGEKKHILFLDTPGHEAFTEMRARGAQVTDVVVLVVAADDGVKPQTVESINHAKAAGVPIVVALNKIDKPEVNDQRIQQIYGQLADHGLNPVAWGGDVEVVKTSAMTGEGLPELLEILDLQGQVLELKADYGGPARGTVVEARMEEGRGPVANLIVQNGELKVGDFIVAGRGYGRVRDIMDDRGQRHKAVGPAMPVQVSGLDDVPDAGDKFYIVESLRQAQEAAEQRRDRERHSQLAQPKVTLDSLFSQMAESEVKEILIVLKADVQGSVDVLRREIEKVSTDEVKARVLHAAVGGITESDVILADASSAIIIGFNVIPSSKARQMAEAKKVEIRTYQVIYEITEDIRKAAEGLLEPELRQEILGHAEVRQVFKISRVGTIAGCYVTDGVVERDAMIRVTRGDVVIENDRVLEQLKRFKDDAKEVRAGNECGMKIVGYDDIKEGDILECYKQVAVKRTF